MKKLLLIFLLSMFITAGCSFTSSSSGPTNTVTEVIEVKKQITEAEINVDFGVGKLSFLGNSEALMDGTFTSNVDSLMPNIKYNEKNEKAVVTLKPKRSGVNIKGNVKNNWDMKFTDQIPLSFQLQLGVGQNDLNFDSLNIKHLTINAGVGQTIINLANVKNKEFDVEIDSGVGSTKIIFSNEQAVVVQIKKGIGRVSARDFSIDGDDYTINADAKEVINVTVKQGIGEVVLETR